MKTNIEALLAALSSSDEGGGYLDERETSVVIDGTYETEPLAAALDEHLVPLSSILKQRDGKIMFLRQGWAEGTTNDGRDFEIAAAGATIVLSIGKFSDGSREVYTIAVEDLAPALLRAVGA
jgi:hypothetical protein